MKEICIGKNESGKRLDSFLNGYLSGATPGFLYKMLRKKNITLNNRKADGKERLVKGDVVRIYFADETLSKFIDPKFKNALNGDFSDFKKIGDDYAIAYKKIENRDNIEILFENDDLIVLNKPAGILSQKSKTDDLSINDWLIGYLINSCKITPEQLMTYRPSVVNRLDRNTSGVMLCACSLLSARVLSKALREHQIRKFYRCVVCGKYNAGAVLHGFMTKDSSKNVNVFRTENSGSEKAKYSETKVELLDYNNALDVSLLEIELVTGRSHQIRSSLCASGFPILGDLKYSGDKNNKQLSKKYNISHQLLHAVRLEFPEDFEDGGMGVSGRYFEAPDMFPPLFKGRN